MKKAVTVSVFPSFWDYEKIFATAKKVGFDGVELTFGEDANLTPNTTDEEYAAIKAAADKAGIELKSILAGFTWTCSPTSNDEATRIKAKGLVKGCLYACKKIGAESVLIVPGYCGVDFIPDAEVVYYIDAYNRALEWMHEYKGLAEELGVDIAIENVWNKFLTSPLDMKNIIDEVNSERVGCYFDVGNVLVNGYPEHWIKILGKRIKKVHFKDFDRDIGNLSGFVDLLKGHVDYTAVMQAFKEIGYDGWCTAEFGCPEDETQAEAYAKSIADAMSDIFGRV